MDEVQVGRYLSVISQTTVFASAWLAIEAPASTGTDWVSYLLNGGPFAIVLLLILLDKLGTHSERDRLRIENTALREKIDALQDEFRGDVIPPLLEQNRLMQEVIGVLDDEDRFPNKRRSTPRRPS